MVAYRKLRNASDAYALCRGAVDRLVFRDRGMDMPRYGEAMPESRKRLYKYEFQIKYQICWVKVRDRNLGTVKK